MNNKVKIILVAIIIIIIAGMIAAYIWLQTSKVQAPVAPFLASDVVQSKASASPQTDFTANTTNWKTFQNDKYGITFLYPDYMEFTGSQVAMAKNILYTVTANYEKDGNNFFYIAVYDRAGSEKMIDQEIADGKNEYSNRDAAIANGPLTVTDGVGLLDSYYASAYFKGTKYIYKFELSRPAYSQELLDLFQRIVRTANLNQ
ncbi:MAG: hypothetical protein WCO55_01260 [Candidatus Falkowbacteria bacterium]